MEGKQPFVLNLPPGYHFAPTDMELIVHYLRRKMDGHPPHLPVFKDVPITDYRPEQITEAFMDCGEDRWYFFTKRTRKYATGNRPDRTTPGRGYWKATGPQRLIRTGAKLLVGRRRTLVFYTGPDEEAKTAWTMYEYENLTSEEEANDKNADKLGEWVLCTIQRQKSPRGGDEGKVKAKAKAGGRKRKGKAQEGADQVLQVQGPEEVVPEMAWPEEGDEMGMFELEQASCPSKRPRIMQQHEPPPPCPETMMPAGDYDYGPLNMAPPSQEPAPRSEAMMMASHCGGSYNNMGSAGIPSSSSSMAWPGPQLSDSEMVASRPAIPCFSFEECMMLMASPVLGVGYNGYSMTTSQPATSCYLHAAPAPFGAFEYGDCGAAHQPAGHLNNGGYAGGYPGSLLGTSNSTYTYPQQHSYAARTSKLASSNSTYNYLQTHSHAAATNKLAPSSSTYTYQQQHSHPDGTTKAAGTNKLASSSSTYLQQHSYAAGTNKADGTSNLATSNSTYTYQQQHSCAAETNKLALVKGAMSSGIGQGSDEQPQVEV